MEYSSRRTMNFYVEKDDLNPSSSCPEVTEEIVTLSDDTKKPKSSRKKRQKSHKPLTEPTSGLIGEQLNDPLTQQNYSTVEEQSYEPVTKQNYDPSGTQFFLPYDPLTKQCGSQGEEIIYKPLDYMALEIQDLIAEQKYDVIGEHLINLRQCYYELNVLIEEVEEEKERLQNTDDDIIGLKRFRKIALPEFPADYPFRDCYDSSMCEKPRKEVECTKITETGQLDEIITYGVKKILLQTGFFVDDSEVNDESPIRYLSLLTHNFLERFTNLMWQNKSSEIFSTSDDMWAPLETTLRDLKHYGIPGFDGPKYATVFEPERGEVEYGGIATLHDFYYERIVKKHDILYEECQLLLKKYEELIASM